MFGRDFILIMVQKTITRLLILSVALLGFGTCQFADAETQSSSDVMNYDVKPLLDAYAKRGGDFQEFLAGQAAVKVPREISIGDDFKKLPVQPDADLLDTIQSQPGDFGPPPFHLAWIARKRVGGLYYTAGSGVCEYWIMFQADGRHATEIYPPDIFLSYVCGNDGGGFGHEAFIAEIGDKVVAIKDGVEPALSGALIFHVYLQVWDGASWEPAAEAEIGVNFKN